LQRLVKVFGSIGDCWLAGLTGKADYVGSERGFPNKGPRDNVGCGDRGDGVLVSRDINCLGPRIGNDKETLWWQGTSAENVLQNGGTVLREQFIIAERCKFFL
jgi:hypothetical protein